LYNQFQISNLKSVVTNQANKTVNIGYIHPKESKHDECESAGDGKLCTYEQELPGGASKEMNGVCYKEKCFVAPSALFNPSTKQPHLTDKSCRAFPEQASPFPPSVVLSGGGYNSFGDPISKSDSHRNANVCQKVDADETLQQCLGCSYQKVTYGPSGTFTKYYDSNATLPGGVCYGGFINSKANISKDGKTCDSTAGCTDERGHIAETERLHGSCQIKKTKQDVIGLDGYCLENDLRNTINGSESQFACQTWYPATLFSGGVDIFNQHVGAGYQVPTNGGGRYMCTKARGNANRVGTSVAVDTSRDSSGFGQFLDDFAKKRNNLCHVFGQGNTIYNKETGQNVSCDLSWHTLFNRPVGLIPGEQKCFENVGDGGVSAAGSCNGMWEHAKQFIPNEIMATYTHLDAHEDYYLQSQGYKLVANSFFAQCNDNCSVRRMASILPKTPHEENPKQYPGYNRVEGSYVLHANKDLRIEDVERAEVYIVRGIAGQGGKDNQYNWYPERKPMTIFSDGTFIGPVEVKADGGKPWDLASGPNEHYMSKTFDKNNRTTMRMYWQNDGWFEMTENEIENKMGTRNDYNATGKSFCYSKYWNRLLVDVVFDNNGQFESVDYRICDSGGGSGQLRFAVIFYLREYCTEVAQVFNQDAVGSLSGSTNMAWTDHVKEDSKFILSPNNVTDTYTASNLLSAERSRPSYSVDQLIAPYGISESLFAPDKTKEIPWVFATGGTTSGANGVTEFVNSGSPLSCPQTSQHVAFNQEGSFTISLGSQNESCGVAMCIGGKNHGARCNDISDCGDERTFSSGTDQVIDKGVCMGVPIHPDDQEPADSGDAFTRPLTFQGLHVPNSIHGSNAELTGSLLANVFARAYGAWEWVSESGNATYKEIGSSPITDPELPRKIINGTEPGLASLKSSTSSSSKQTYNSRRYGDELHPPIVSGVDCSGGICDKSTYSKLTINSKNEGFIIGGSGTLAARARFYAEAGTNQMPLRRIAIDWEGNGEEVADFNGMYKNRKPACEGSKFGSSEAACDSGFYQFIHVYSFSDCLNNNTDFELRTVGDDSQGKIVSGVTGQVFDPYAYGFVNGDRYCAFQPSVQIMDNWGWCNGSCESYSVPNSVAGEPNLNFKGCWEDLNSTDDDDPKLCTANEGGFDNASDSFKGWVIIKENIDS